MKRVDRFFDRLGFTGKKRFLVGKVDNLAEPPIGLDNVSLFND